MVLLEREREGGGQTHNSFSFCLIFIVYIFIVQRQVKQNYFINYVYKINKSMTEQQQAKMIDDLQFLKIMYNNSPLFFPHCRVVTFFNIFHFSHIPPGNAKNETARR